MNKVITTHLQSKFNLLFKLPHLISCNFRDFFYKYYFNLSIVLYRTYWIDPSRKEDISWNGVLQSSLFLNLRLLSIIWFNCQFWLLPEFLWIFLYVSIIIWMGIAFNMKMRICLEFCFEEEWEWQSDTENIIITSMFVMNYSNLITQ